MTGRTRPRLPVFLRRERRASFLTVVLSGQIIYASFEAFKGSLMLPFQEMLGITSQQYGMLMGYIGIAMFLYVPAGWVNNRFKVRTILFWALAWRLGTCLVLFLALPPFAVMAVIAMSWGVTDAIAWPAVVNGVALMSADQDARGRGLAMGLLESLRRGLEFLMNGAVILALVVWSDQAGTVMRVAAIAYTLLIVPMMITVARRVPDTRVAAEQGRSASMAALLGLLRVLARPRVWLAGLAGLAAYWTYINLIYASAPYLTQVFDVGPGTAAAFGILNTGLVGVLAGLVSGLIADYAFRSSTAMLAASLGLVAVSCGAVLLLLDDAAMIWLIVGLLVVVSFATFLAKSVILAPVAELDLPEEVSGSAMSVGSFLAYASIFWAYTLNGRILDLHADDPAVGYGQIFTITVVVAVGGLVTAVLLLVSRRRDGTRAAPGTGEPADDDDRSTAAAR